MKVVLLKDVRGVGRAHDTIEAKDGHALNYLIPKKLAVAATPGAQKVAGMHLEKVQKSRELADKLIAERLAALADGHLTITKKVNEKGHLYDAVDSKELAQVAELPVDAITLEKPIKERGEFTIPVAYGANFGSFKLLVEGE